MRTAREDEGEFDIPLTPLIDVVFLLLIFFLVATNFSRKEIDLNVKVPSTAGGEKKSKQPKILVINIRSEGTIVIDGKIIEFANVRSRLKTWHAARPQGTVEIRGDAATRYEHVAKVLGLCSAAGISQVNLPTRRLKNGGRAP